jgi:hypothetical protein
VPIIVCICLHFGIGGIITNLKFGIVNGEVESYRECYNDSLMTADIGEYDCLLKRASCEFIRKIDDEFASKVSFAKLKLQ